MSSIIGHSSYSQDPTPLRQGTVMGKGVTLCKSRFKVKSVGRSSLMSVCMLMAVVPGMQISSGVVPSIRNRASFSWPSHCFTLFRLGWLFEEEPKSNLMGRMEAAAREGKRKKEVSCILLLLDCFFDWEDGAESATYKRTTTDQTVFSYQTPE